MTDLIGAPEGGPEVAFEPPTCYICFEECDAATDVSRCSCTERYVHRECLLKHIRTSGRTKCTVCQAEFADLTVTTTKRMTGRAKIVFGCLGLNTLIALAILIRWNVLDCVAFFAIGCGVSFALELIMELGFWLACITVMLMYTHRTPAFWKVEVRIVPRPEPRADVEMLV